MMLNTLCSWANQEEDPRVAKNTAKTIGIDTHSHIDVPLNSAELPDPKVDLLGKMKMSGLLAISMTFAIDYQKLTKAYEDSETHQPPLTKFQARPSNLCSRSGQHSPPCCLARPQASWPRPNFPPRSTMG